MCKWGRLVLFLADAREGDSGGCSGASVHCSFLRGPDGRGPHPSVCTADSSLLKGDVMGDDEKRHGGHSRPGTAA